MIDWSRIETFVGFGRRDAPVVFGMEEDLKSADALDEDLAIRSAYASPIMDLKEAHRGIAGTERYFDPERAPRQRRRASWPTSCCGEGVDAPTGADRRHYRATRLGRSDGDTLLAELLPYPRPKSSGPTSRAADVFAVSGRKEQQIMSRALLEVYIAIIACWYIGVAFASMQFLKTQFKDVIPLLVAVPIAWIGFVFQSLQTYLTQIHSMWSKILFSVEAAVDYADGGRQAATRDQHRRVLFDLRCAIDEYYGVFTLREMEAGMSGA